jgi:GT2 family glycosyltransferase
LDALTEPGRRPRLAEVDWVQGAFYIIRPVALVGTGLFNPAFFLYCQEVDLYVRIKRSGYKICYCPDVSIIHIGVSFLANSTSTFLPLAPRLSLEDAQYAALLPDSRLEDSCS